MTLPLTVPPPLLSLKMLGGAYAALEGPVTLSFPAVRFPDGTSMTRGDYVGAQALISRVASLASTPDFWNAATKAWVPFTSATDLSQLTGVPLLPPEMPGAPWLGTLIAVGQKDAAGADQFSVGAPGFPFYRVRGLFQAKRGDVAAIGIGPDSQPIVFASMAEQKPFKVELTPAAETATRARLMLKSPAGQTLGMIDIDASSGNTALTLANFDSSGSPIAAIALQPDGSIVLTPAPTMAGTVSGSLSVAGSLNVAGGVSYVGGGGLTVLP